MKSKTFLATSISAQIRPNEGGQFSKFKKSVFLKPSNRYINVFECKNCSKGPLQIKINLDLEEELEDMNGRNVIDSPISDGTIEEDFEQALAK